MLKHVWNLLTEPHVTWVKIREDNPSVGQTMLGVVVPLGLISPICGFIGTTRFGWQIGHRGPVKLTVDSALPITIVYFVAIVVAVLAIGALIRWMSESYGNRLSLSQSVALAAYTAVPLFLVGVFQIFPVLWVNFLAGLPALAYALFLLYCGVPTLMEIPKERGFLFASAVMAVGLIALVGLLVTTVTLWSFGLSPTFS